jgi:hypothetical protein
MGKTYRATPNSTSVSYHSPHDRGFSKKKKAYSHSQIRTANRKFTDEDDFIKSDNMPNKMKYHWMMSVDKDSYNRNIPNMPDKVLINMWEEDDHDHHQEKITQNTLLANLEHRLKTAVANPDCYRCNGCFEYLKATIKQVKRRGNAQSFKIHREQNAEK